MGVCVWGGGVCERGSLRGDLLVAERWALTLMNHAASDCRAPYPPAPLPEPAILAGDAAVRGHHLSFPPSTFQICMRK